MVTIEDDAESVSFTTTELRPAMMDWSAEDVHKEFTIFKTLAKMWLEHKGVPDHKQYILILQLQGKEGLCQWKSFLLATNKNNKEQPDQLWEAFEGSFRHVTSFRSYRKILSTTFTSRRNSSMLIWIPDLLFYSRNTTTFSAAWTPTKLTYSFMQ